MNNNVKPRNQFIKSIHVDTNSNGQPNRPMPNNPKPQNIQRNMSMPNNPRPQNIQRNMSMPNNPRPQNIQKNMSMSSNARIPNNSQKDKNSIKSSKPCKKIYKGNMMKKIKTIAITAGIVGGLAGVGIYVEDYNNKQYARDLQSEIETMAKEELRDNLKDNLDEIDFTFDGDKFNIAYDCSRTELYNVLKKTDLDELLNTYFENPTHSQKEKLLSQLEGREEELAKFNMDLIEASFADSKNISKDKVNIDFEFVHYDSYEKEKIINGKIPSRGYTLTISDSTFNKVSAINEYDVANNETIYNFNQIDEDKFKLIGDAILQVEFPNYSTNEENSKIENAIETYKGIKKIINDKNFTIKDEKVLVVDIDQSKDKEDELEH